MEMENAQSAVTLVSNDGQRFEVPLKDAFRSITIKNMFDTLEGAALDEIPFDDLNGAILNKMVEWMTCHGEDAPWNEEQEKDHKVVDQWDRDWFSKMDLNMHFEVIKAANYLEMKRLLDNACKLIASMMVGQKVEHVREKFGIVNDYTKEEEDAIKLENAWLED